MRYHITQGAERSAPLVVLATPVDSRSLNPLDVMNFVPDLTREINHLDEEVADDETREA